jgi:Icc-related predicted phosphoesterase
MKIWHISDTHGNHDQLKVPNDIDIVIFSGDGANYRDPIENLKEYNKFFYWFKNLPIEYKILIAGNHDTCIEANLFDKREFKLNGIEYLENSGLIINNINFWGSPITPTFNDWSFMKSRHKIYKVWDMIPTSTDVLITHGAPKGVLDLTENHKRQLEMVGCSNLNKQVFKRIKPKLHLFGHIHNRHKNVYNNNGILTINNITFSNASLVQDGKIDRIINNGNILTI